MVDCPVCGKNVKESVINLHLDSGCERYVDQPASSQPSQTSSSSQVSSFFKLSTSRTINGSPSQRSQVQELKTPETQSFDGTPTNASTKSGSKRQAADQAVEETAPVTDTGRDATSATDPPAKRLKPSNALQKAAPLAERMRPRTLDEVCGQELVGPDGVLRGLIETDRSHQ